MPDTLLRIYLNDHLAGSVAAIGQGEHCLSKNPDGDLAALLTWVLEEIREDRAVLQDLVDRIGGAENPLKQAVSWVSEKVERAKPSGEVLGYSDLNRLEELETLAIGIIGKRTLWDGLGAVCASDERFRGVDFRSLAQRAQRQRDALEPHRIEAARRAFASRAAETGETP